MRAGIALTIGCFSVLLGGLGCEPSHQKPTPMVGSNSNWLTACEAPADCSQELLPECACGVCTVPCTRDDDCGELLMGRCAVESSAAARSTCEAISRADGAANVTIGICLPSCTPGQCEAWQACVDGACVLASVPGNAFCEDVDEGTAETIQEDDLFAQAQQRRGSGELVCGDQAMSVAQPQLRFSAGLRCAARALAIDIDRTRALSVIDSEGRATQDRMQLAGYAATLWGEAFAIQAISAEDALRIMLQDEFTCQRLASADFTDLGVGVSGNVYILTLGAR